ncbi:hypothetical protein Hanom_Chr08g00731221 [Helianthus anomalus]
MCVSIKQVIRFRLRVDTSADNHSNNQTVNPQHSSHNNRHNRLHHQLRPHHSHRRHSNAALRCPVRRPHTCTTIYGEILH